MSDTSLRLAERAHESNPSNETRLALISAQLRAGALDPRWDPVKGAEVEAVGRYTGSYSSRVRREVVRVWPGRLVSDIPVVQDGMWYGPAGSSLPEWLPAGSPVLSAYPLSTELRDGERRTVTWDVVAARRDGGAWMRVVTAEEPDVASLESSCWREGWAPLAAEAVEWEHRGETRTRKPQRSTIAAWRKWARGGTVLYLPSPVRS